MGTAAMVPRDMGGELFSPARHFLSTMSNLAIGVVDPTTMKVYGTSNLRVVDASVIPQLIATHPQSTVYAIAEKVSILASHCSPLTMLLIGVGHHKGIGASGF